MYSNSLILYLCSSASEDQIESVNRSSFRWQSSFTLMLQYSIFPPKKLLTKTEKKYYSSAKGRASGIFMNGSTNTDTKINFQTHQAIVSQSMVATKRFCMAESGFI